jgi:hypothetical protein
MKTGSVMAEDVTIGGGGSLFVGEDKVIRLELFLKSDSTVSVDWLTWSTIFDVRRKDTSLDPALISLTPAVSGTFNAVRALNAQRGLVFLTDDLMNLFKAKTYRWSWKRMDAGGETVLARGDFAPEKATAP